MTYIYFEKLLTCYLSFPLFLPIFLSSLFFTLMPFLLIFFFYFSFWPHTFSNLFYFYMFLFSLPSFFIPFFLYHSLFSSASLIPCFRGLEPVSISMMTVSQLCFCFSALCSTTYAMHRCRYCSFQVQCFLCST